MNWENPGILSLIWLEPIIVALAYYSYRSRKKALDRFIDQDAQKRLAPKLSGGRAAFKTLCLLLAITFFIVALARPRFGVYYEQVQRRGADMFILLDVSKSMDAQDVMPSRLEKAKADCLNLLKELKGERVGLIVFVDIMLYPATIVRIVSLVIGVKGGESDIWVLVDFNLLYHFALLSCS